MMKTWALVAAAAMGLTACQNDYEEQIEAKDKVVVSFLADAAEGRTSVNTEGDAPVFAWDDAESFAVLEQTDNLAVATDVNFSKKENGSAEITAAFDYYEYEEGYKYVAVYPETGYVSGDFAEATLTLPAEQTMVAGSYDPAADLMVSKVVATDVQPTEIQPLRFTRLAAVAKMNFRGIEAGDKIESVTFAAEGKTIAGNLTASLEKPYEFTVAEGGSNSVTVKAAGEDAAYFTLLPTTLEAGESYTVTVITDKKIYVKEGTIAEGKTLQFAAGMVTRFGVDLTGVAPSEKWVLVKDASTLKQGDIVTIAAKNYNYVVGKQGNNYPLASQTEVVKFGDYLYHPIATAETSVDNRMQQYVLLQRDVNRVAFDFYNGVDYEGDTSVGFVQAAGVNYSPKIQAFCDKSTLYDVTITNGVATLYASEIEQTYKWWRYYHATSASSRRFDATSSEPTGNYQVCLYRIEGAVGTIPTVAANVTVPEADESAVVAEEAATMATAIPEVVFNYVGDWTITATSEAEWLTSLNYDKVQNCLTYTADANTGAARDTTVTITASREGEEDITWSFKLTQKGAPEEISIVELRGKAKDTNAVYKITGIVKTLPTSSTGNWVIVDNDGKEAKIAHLKMDGGGYALDKMDVQVGDIITVTTIVTGTNGTYACGKSDYPSTYKGHYTISATASGAVSFEGGDATIDVEVKKFGHIVAPTTISDKSNIATDNNPVSAYSFTDNGDGTAKAVVSFGENTTGGTRNVDLTFSAGSQWIVSTSISIVQDVNPALKTGWWLITDVNDLKAGDEIIIAATGLDYAVSTTTYTNNRKSTAITKDGGALKDVSESVQVYSLEIVDGLYAFKGTLGDDVGKYIYAPDTKNYMKVTNTLDDRGKWTISIAGDGAATIVSKGAATHKYMQYNNKAASSPAFYCTDGSMGAVCLYKNFK